ncbi:MAG TPA: ABC transporter ATP-binding protein [Trueperaceae bacterium]
MAGIRARDIRKTFRLPGGAQRLALGGVDLDIADGEFISLLGPSGCGKTTLLNILSGLEPEYRGRIEFTNGSSEPGTRPRFSYMFQESRLLPWRTVRDNLRFVLRGTRNGSADDAIDEWLARVGLSGSSNLYPAQLSVGMQQRVSLARALIVRPEVLFMDEPLSALDELTATQMRDELLSLWMEQQPTVVFVTHNPLEAVYLSDRVLIMSPGPGRIIEVLDIKQELPRPRSAEDSRVWELSRECVRVLRGEGAKGGLAKSPA